MKTYSMFNLVLVLLFSSCSVIEFPDTETSSNEITKSTIMDLGNKVSVSDIHHIISREFSQNKSAVSLDYKIESYISKTADTLMYIVNFDNNRGWRIYSSDKRTPAIIAEGENGYFSIEEGSPAVGAWISYVADNLSKVHRATDEELTFSDAQIQENRSFWADNKIIISHNQTEEFSTKSAIYPAGHWEEIVTSSTETYECIEHMVAKWDQYAPYNECCPYYEGSTTRAVAGCVAIAGAQVLFYLHNKLGVPDKMYSMGTCTGDINNYSQSFSRPARSTWDNMSMNYTSSSSTMLPEAILIGYVGQRVNMHYANNFDRHYSWALPENLKSDLFEYYGINCIRGDYDPDVVKNSLLDYMPVIVSASNLLIPVDGRIHCFVIDGYKKEVTKYIHYHHYVLDNPSQGNGLLPASYYTYTYSQPYFARIKINWGWWNQWDQISPVNDGWYSLTDDWTVTNNENTYDYNYYRKMIYGFNISE